MEDIKNTQSAFPMINTESQNRLRSMLACIHSHYADKLTLAQIAASANISEREALRCFQKNLNQSPFEYLISFRLNEVKKLLTETDFGITPLAYRSM